jgi:hypothetical protein
LFQCHVRNQVCNPPHDFKPDGTAPMRVVPRFREQESAAAHQGVAPKLLTQIALRHCSGHNAYTDLSNRVL